MSHENVELVQRSLDAWNRGASTPGCAGLTPRSSGSPRWPRRVEGSETVYRGTAGLRRFRDEWHIVWDVTIHLTEVRDLGDTVVAFGA